MKKLFIILLAATLLAGCGTTTDTPDITPPSGVETTPTVTDQDTDYTNAVDTVQEQTDSPEPVDTEEPTPETDQETAKQEEPADLHGEWIQKDWENRDTYMIASISDDTIEINWCMDGGETVMLYWAGTYTAPESAGDYSWNSINDTSRTEFAIMASGDETKTFTFSNGEITYSQSALGMTTTVHMVKSQDGAE